ncbi:MAG: cellulose synthase [Gammaproteobacteria bacterium]|uniref:cellulose biosynthesis protein BcsD n=1 Tax=Rhodoferax sp. TaxID=50421 RepID=UPI00179B50DF|nr:cellulose biosynthesis protein BcsD [Rhodoferax sp.]MBU3900570.1 cellulose synthase [Gammaproteobacteria bacterium]MBA3057525.1 cellulose synthase [Rhodoferax sp.]MBU4080015.1 cellulose synthase [Gammaproteobacteria bacterium]MBU4113471.1 cellulose synthase [Gammaproteobacteria bacterium]MBU4172093.1 cellulose synthase [Gammaproteobacteria bacterium]
MTSDNLQSYFRGQQVSLQWLPVLRAMASEMSAHTEVRDLRQLFFRVGERFAKDAEEIFQGAQTLTQLEDSLNDFWNQINWGWVDLTEVDGYIDIAHQTAPLAEAFGDDALNWSIGLLEGFYQSVFSVLGASDTMVVRGIDELSQGMDIRLRFGRASN